MRSALVVHVKKVAPFVQGRDGKNIDVNQRTLTAGCA